MTGYALTPFLLSLALTHTHCQPLFISFSLLTYFCNPPTLLPSYFTLLYYLHSCIFTTSFSTAFSFLVCFSCTCTTCTCMIVSSLPVWLCPLCLYLLHLLYLYCPGLSGVVTQCYPGGPRTSLSWGHPFRLSLFFPKDIISQGAVISDQ